jgi:hypothetical protein
MWQLQTGTLFEASSCNLILIKASSRLILFVERTRRQELSGCFSFYFMLRACFDKIPHLSLVRATILELLRLSLPSSDVLGCLLLERRFGLLRQSPPSCVGICARACNRIYATGINLVLKKKNSADSGSGGAINALFACWTE